MARKFIAKSKMAEKQKREIDRLKRVTWTMNPVTRVKPSGRIYDRKKYRATAYGE
ncbi:MAG: hypothetical protein IJ719_19600 [Clostridia bacterium]|nr:hypothetical protein [Clostridia bacterium]